MSIKLTSCFILEPSKDYRKGPRNTYYKYFDEEKAWDDAKKDCEAQDAHMVNDDSDDVHNYLKENFKPQFWIGATDMEQGEWKWVNRKRMQKAFWEDGRNVDKSFWEDGQPGSDGKDEDCALMLGDEWHDASCKNHKAPYVCQKKGL